MAAAEPPGHHRTTATTSHGATRALMRRRDIRTANRLLQNTTDPSPQAVIPKLPATPL